MSNKDKIRETIYALAAREHLLESDGARLPLSNVMSSKGAMIVGKLFDDTDLEEGDYMVSAGKKHLNAGKKRDRTMKKMDHDKRTHDMKKSVSEGIDDLFEKFKNGEINQEELASGILELEENDTGSDSPTMKGSHDKPYDDVTARKGSVKDAKNIDHKDYTGDKPNVYKNKDARDGKPVNEGDKRDVVDWSDVKDAAMKTAKKIHGDDLDTKKVNDVITNAKKHKPDSTAAAIEQVQAMLSK